MVGFETVREPALSPVFDVARVRGFASVLGVDRAAEREVEREVGFEVDFDVDFGASSLSDADLGFPFPAAGLVDRFFPVLPPNTRNSSFFTFWARFSQVLFLAMMLV